MQEKGTYLDSSNLLTKGTMEIPSILKRGWLRSGTCKRQVTWVVVECGCEWLAQLLSGIR